MDDYGGDRAGADLWTVSMRAIAKTGELAWGYQEVHHDIWDYDASNQPTMINVTVNGKKVEGIVQSDKDGFAYFVNAENGEPVFPITEEAVQMNTKADQSYPTQPIPSMPPFVELQATPENLEHMQTGINEATVRKNGEIKKEDETITKENEAIKTENNKLEEEGKKPTKTEKPLKAEITAPKVENGGWKEQDVFSAYPLPGEPDVFPSSGGGAGDREAPSSYDPATGDYYVCSVNGSMSATVIAGEEWEWIEGGAHGEEGGKTFMSGGGLKATGTLTAYNMTTGAIAWQDKLAEQCYSGALTTAGNVLFTGRNNGEMVAYEATTGKQLWSFETGAGVNAPASTFEWNGKEYVAQYAGGAAHGPNSTLGDNLWLFQLNGTGPGPIELGKTPKCEAEAPKCNVGELAPETGKGL